MQIPRSLVISDQHWTIKLKDKIDGGKSAGECCSGNLEITICDNMSDYEKIVTLIHECLHAIEFGSGVKLGHKIINQLENPLASIVVQLCSK